MLLPLLVPMIEAVVAAGSTELAAAVGSTGLGSLLESTAGRFLFQKVEKGLRNQLNDAVNARLAELKKAKVPKDDKELNQLLTIQSQLNFDLKKEMKANAAALSNVALRGVLKNLISDYLVKCLNAEGLAEYYPDFDLDDLARVASIVKGFHAFSQMVAVAFSSRLEASYSKTNGTAMLLDSLKEVISNINGMSASRLQFLLIKDAEMRKLLGVDDEIMVSTIATGLSTKSKTLSNLSERSIAQHAAQAFHLDWLMCVYLDHYSSYEAMKQDLLPYASAAEVLDEHITPDDEFLRGKFQEDPRMLEAAPLGRSKLHGKTGVRQDSMMPVLIELFGEEPRLLDLMQAFDVVTPLHMIVLSKGGQVLHEDVYGTELAENLIGLSTKTRDFLEGYYTRLNSEVGNIFILDGDARVVATITDLFDNYCAERLALENAEAEENGAVAGDALYVNALESFLGISTESSNSRKDDALAEKRSKHYSNSGFIMVGQDAVSGFSNLDDDGSIAERVSQIALSLIGQRRLNVFIDSMSSVALDFSTSLPGIRDVFGFKSLLEQTIPSLKRIVNGLDHNLLDIVFDYLRNFVLYGVWAQMDVKVVDDSSQFSKFAVKDLQTLITKARELESMRRYKHLGLIIRRIGDLLVALYKDDPLVEAFGVTLRDVLSYGIGLKANPEFDQDSYTNTIHALIDFTVMSSPTLEHLADDDILRISTVMKWLETLTNLDTLDIDKYHKTLSEMITKHLILGTSLKTVDSPLLSAPPSDSYQSGSDLDDGKDVNPSNEVTWLVWLGFNCKLGRANHYLISE